MNTRKIKIEGPIRFLNIVLLVLAICSYNLTFVN